MRYMSLGYKVGTYGAEMSAVQGEHLYQNECQLRIASHAVPGVFTP
jgi:hypothetical protein